TPMIERNTLLGVVVSFSDITERHRSEAELQRSHRQLEETLAQLKTTQRQVLQQERLRAMGEMASGIAHDFNNSLSPIVGFAELLLRRPNMPTETAQQYVKLINTAAPDAAVDLGRCLEEATALTEPRWKSQAQSRGINIKVVRDVVDVPVILGD